MIDLSEREITRQWNTEKYKKPEVTIWCTTYNHEKFIAQCLDSFLMQKTNFPFEIIVHDDASLDHTSEIIREYETKYPSIIKPIIEEENLYSRDLLLFRLIMVKHINTKYVATCEGDDYWSDECKLQKQYDFMECNQEYSAIGHLTRTIDSSNQDVVGSFIDSVTGEYGVKENQNWQLFAHYSSYFYRNIFLKMTDREKNNFFSLSVPGDRSYPILFMKYGKLYVLPEEMSVYRYMSCPTSFTCQKENHSIYKCYMESVNLDKYAMSIGIDVDYSQHQKKLLCNAFGLLVKSGNRDFIRIIHIRNNYIRDFGICFVFVLKRVWNKILHH